MVLGNRSIGLARVVAATMANTAAQIGNALDQQLQQQPAEQQAAMGADGAGVVQVGGVAIG